MGLKGSLEGIRENAQKILEKRTWIRKAFQELMVEIWRQIRVDDTFPACCGEYNVVDVKNVFGQKEQELHYSLCFNGRYLWIVVEDRLDYYQGAKDIFGVAPGVVEDEPIVESTMSVREIREFLENFDKALGELQARLKIERGKAEEAAEKLKEILEKVKA